jgi:hypothetical protein
MRANSTVVASDAGATMAAFINALAGQFRLITIDAFRSSLPGSNVSVLETWPGAATYGSGAGSPFETAQYYDFVGRAPSGRRVRAALFGAINVQVGGDYRISTTEQTEVANALAELTSDVDMWLAVDYDNPVWHMYANCGVNAYWRNKVR